MKKKELERMSLAELEKQQNSLKKDIEKVEETKKKKKKKIENHLKSKERKIENRVKVLNGVGFFERIKEPEQFIKNFIYCTKKGDIKFILKYLQDETKVDGKNLVALYKQDFHCLHEKTIEDFLKIEKKI